MRLERRNSHRHDTAAMPLFWKHHQSDISRFIETLKRERPSLEAEQRAGRALLWDRAIDREAQADWREANVPQQPYVYQAETVVASPSAVPAASPSATSTVNPVKP
jgi:hypothetical protein